MITYKVLEVLWKKEHFDLDFEQEYCGTFKTLNDAKQYVNANVNKWEKDLSEDDDGIGIGIEIETWERPDNEEDDSFDDLIDTYTEWCKDKEVHNL